MDFIHWIFFPFGITFSSSAPLVSSSEGLLAVLRRAVIIGGTAGNCKRVQILWIFANLVCLFLNNTRSFASCIGCNTTLFPGCLIVGGGGRGWAAWRGHGWRCGGEAGRTGIGRDGADRDGLVWETVRLSEEGRGGGRSFLLTFVGPDLFLLLRHEAFWGLSPLVSAPAFASFFFSWFPTTPDNGARGAALTSVVASLKQAAPLVTSPSRFSFWKLFKDPGRDNFLLSSCRL